MQDAADQLWSRRDRPTCYANNLRDQLVASGWTGTANIIGNDNSGTCP